MRKLIMVGSITHALKGRDILRQRGFKAYIERTPSNIDRVGCGYSIYVIGDAESAADILREKNIRVYGISDGGSR